MLMGVLGGLEWSRCRRCGLDHSRRAEPPADPLSWLEDATEEGRVFIIFCDDTFTHKETDS
jgi:hypothetical protein